MLHINFKGYCLIIFLLEWCLLSFHFFSLWLCLRGTLELLGQQFRQYSVAFISSKWGCYGRNHRVIAPGVGFNSHDKVSMVKKFSELYNLDILCIDAKDYDKCYSQATLGGGFPAFQDNDN
ncbi:hypothetical protein KFK09_000668 [Dendrobium nobile]|uniref:Uncharacterized protein n=1 Tax=Dendrobium nobile TaxID=94219 RepID=A0A8T3CBR1_DENNO|nr:hypothetical protein KFK09_000668 [Dendrobium nobile]